MTILALLAATAFCRIATPTALEYAPDYIWPSWNTPTAADYLAHGWLHNRVVAPTNAVGMIARLDRYEARGDGVEAVYAYEPIPYVPRRIYKYDLSAACVEYDFLDSLMGFINQDARVKWFWDAAEILVENDPYFIAATNAVIASGVDEAKVKAIIERAVELGSEAEASK